MKTVNTFVPRLRGGEYVRVSTCRLCPEPADSEALCLLRESLRQLVESLRYYREHGCLPGADAEEEDAEERAEEALEARVEELRRRELVFFTPPAGRKWPDWSRICSVRRQLAPLWEALEAELLFLEQAAPFVGGVWYGICAPFLPKAGLVPEPEEYAAAFRLHEVQLNRPSLLCGGEGFSLETALLIRDEWHNVPQMAGAMFRYAYETDPTRRYSVEQDGRHYEVLVLDRAGDGGDRRESTLWFDITAYRRSHAR